MSTERFRRGLVAKSIAGSNKETRLFRPNPEQSPSIQSPCERPGADRFVRSRPFLFGGKAPRLKPPAREQELADYLTDS